MATGVNGTPKPAGDAATIVGKTLIALAAVTAPAFAAMSGIRGHDAPFSHGEASADRVPRHAFGRYASNNAGRLVNRELAAYRFELRNSIVGAKDATGRQADPGLRPCLSSGAAACSRCGVRCAGRPRPRG